MSNIKNFKLVMLPTSEKATSLGIRINNDTPLTPVGKLAFLSNMDEDYFDNKDWIHQSLYIVSNEEIKEGDWKYNPILNHVVKHLVDNDGDVKIISSTVKSITPNSWIPESFIKEYVKHYNQDNPITVLSLDTIPMGLTERGECEIDMLDRSFSAYPREVPNGWYKYFIPKTDKDGSVIIRLPIPEPKFELTIDDLKRIFKAGQDSIDPIIKYEKYGDMDAYAGKEIKYDFEAWKKQTYK